MKVKVSECCEAPPLEGLIDIYSECIEYSVFYTEFWEDEDESS